jgi:hypothetical protein
MGVVLLGPVSAQPTSTQRLEGIGLEGVGGAAGDSATTLTCAEAAPDPPTVRVDTKGCPEPEDLLLAIAQRAEGNVCVAVGDGRSSGSGPFRIGSLGEDPGTLLFEDDFESGSLDAWSRVATQVCPAAPANPVGCPACTGACSADPWNVSWTAVPGASHYILEYQCSAFPIVTYQTTSTVADLCHEVGMCEDGHCASGVGSIGVRACHAGCCSPKVTFHPSGTPITCGGGLCC